MTSREGSGRLDRAMYDDDTEQLPVYRSGGVHGAAQTPTPEPRRTRRAGPISHRRSGESHRMRYAGRGLMSLFAVGVIGVTGVAWYGETSLDNGFTKTGVISEEDRASLGGDVNILLIGLDTRKDLNGNDLPKDILDQLHAGDGSEGGYNANSLILVHIPKDLKTIVAFSIPRDDYVPASGIPGYDHIKIKEAYGLKKFYAEEKLKAQGMTDKNELERQGREAGRASIVQAVKSLTGVPINRFAEVSLVGFYHLADALGGVDVCLNHAVDDSYFSGAVFPAGPQHLDAANALSFVRQRHGLENGDLDRTHRQQAFLTSVSKQLKDSGTITNIGKMKALMDVAHRDVVLSDGWSLTDFITTLGRADSPSVEFRTLPVLRYDTVDGQDVNIIDPAAIKKEVRAAFGVEQPTVAAAPRTTPTSTVDVVNATGTPGMAAKVSKSLGDKGFTPGDIGNATYSDGTSTVLYYGAGADTDAQSLADMLGGSVTPAASTTLGSGQIRLVLGTDFEIPETLDPTATSSTTTTTTTSKSAATSTSNIPDNGKPVTTTIGGSIPCVN
ncbi:LCP family protein [Nocardia sp. NBC_01503]|nr:LCP family protein [Nocardia sp. NBC_01503]WTL32304.1 LCP family protein [Nocardia sp. NBC_01503]